MQQSIIDGVILKHLNTFNQIFLYQRILKRDELNTINFQKTETTEMKKKKIDSHLVGISPFL